MKTNRLVHLSPARFYALTAVMESVGDGTRQWLDGKCRALKALSSSLDAVEERLGKSVKAMDDEIRGAIRRNSPRSFDEYEEAGKDLRHSAGEDTNFLRVAHTIVSGVKKMYGSLYDMSRDLQPGDLALFRDGTSPVPKDHQDFQAMVAEVELNQGAVIRFLEACNQLEMAEVWLTNAAIGIEEVLSIYHRALTNRHSVQGVHIHVDPVITDIALTIYENIDAHGEVQDGRDPNEVSSFTVRKAEVLVNALKDEFMNGLIQRPDRFIDVVRTSFLTMQYHVKDLQERFRPQLNRVLEITDEAPLPKDEDALFRQLEALNDVSPGTVVFKDRSVLLSSDERFNLDFKNRTVKRIVDLITAKDLDIREVIQYVLNRKAELRKYFQEENSFYVCRIGSGNPFLGEAPGALQVIPGTRPNAKMSDILGSGYDEVVNFADSIEAASEFNDLFVATSPSKTADKSNVLLVGPMGCGKSEVLRAVGADRKSITIFAQGSDFNTCWKGEMEKNPKRLFEQAVKLQKESRRHVHICIDEIDSILNNDRDPGSTNLNLEFQILMDGVVHYPNISVWGATNHIERIPMPMIRRFSKILVVGELTQEDRVKLLKRFLSYMPLSDVRDSDWEGWARRLDGATGDVLRKVADVVWRRKMTDFVRSHPAQAKMLVGLLNDGGEKFEVSRFDQDRRAAFKAALGRHMTVSSDDIEASVKANLCNIGVLSEIQTAKETYANAKKYLAHLASTAVS